jgi:predicted hydrocarbon binding protein
MGFGELELIEQDEDKERWIFTGQNLIEISQYSQKPTCNYTLGFLCGTVSTQVNSLEIVGVETECQSMGDEECKLIIQKRKVKE